jgi:multidrug efflux system membrane fusion protein
MMHDDSLRADAQSPATPAEPRTTPAHGGGSWATRIILALLLAGGVGGGLWLVRARGKAAAAGAAAAASAMQNRIVPVLTAEVAKHDVPMWREGLGSVSAFYTVTVKTQVDGRIDRVAFTEGQHVKKGDLLVQIDPRPFAIQLQSAQAALARDAANEKNARVNAERYKTLSQQNLIAVQQYTDQQASVDQLAAQVQADQAQIDAARLNLDYAHITSPIDGVTGVRLVDPGNVVHATDTTGLVVVTQLDPIALFFTLPEDDLPAISAARQTTPDLSVEAFSRDGDKPLGRGKLSVVDNEINQATATIRLKAIFDNPQSALWPNQFVKARITLSTRHDALTVPAAVIQQGPSGTFAYVVSASSTAEMRPVVVDVIQGDTAILKSGLAAGEQVVVDGQAQLRPGAKVSARPAPTSRGSTSASAGATPSPRPSAAP